MTGLIQRGLAYVRDLWRRMWAPVGEPDEEYDYSEDPDHTMWW